MKTYVSIVPQEKYLVLTPCSLHVYQEHVSSLFCSVLIYLFLMEAKLGLAVLGILIPRDLAALNCFSF